MNNVIYITRDSDQTNASSAHVRSNRYFKLSDFWYFTTREGATLGPYDAKEQAEQAASDYIQFVSQAKPSIIKLLATH